jgi:hypothetical protein
MAIPASWKNPIVASVGQVQTGADPKVLLPSRPHLLRSRLEAQRRLLLGGVARCTPVKATSAGVIFDGHHMVRAAAEDGMLIDVSIIGIAQPPVGEMILDLPVR